MYEREAMGYAPRPERDGTTNITELAMQQFSVPPALHDTSIVGFAEINWRDLTVTWIQALSANATNVRQY